ncbi:MAG TPA: hypothetical protein RMH99_29075 [Sandaracinaceae bacterium LLY-WYZ-13_1]|nr:hypothetical protein [Sandaracinaceae bacterium LLY-WYZ-13_1]
MRRAILAGLALLVCAAPGCAFFAPVWEFEAVDDPGVDGGGPGRDAGEEDGGPPSDGAPDGDGGSGWLTCTGCTVETDDGCPDGAGCYVNQDLECTVCVARSGRDASLGEACGTGPDCRPGLDCIAGRCVTFCASGPDCEDDEACLASGLEALGWCLGMTCEPTDPDACPGGACQPFNGLTPARGVLGSVCGGSGANEARQACGEGCAPVHACFGATEPACERLCRDGSGCPSGEECTPIGNLGGELFGICTVPCSGDSDCPADGVPHTCQMMSCLPG